MAGRLRVIPGNMERVLPRVARAGVLFDGGLMDPPYHLHQLVARFGDRDAAPPRSDGPSGVYARSARGFMGHSWDGGDVALRAETWGLVRQVLKPGAHVIVMGGVKTEHRVACALEDAGFEVRDKLTWHYGSGFPKNHNVGGGQGTALKPATEFGILARAPMTEKSVAANVARWGTGALQVEACRLPSVGEQPGNRQMGENVARTVYAKRPRVPYDGSAGRWPANVAHDGSPEVLARFGASASTGGQRHAVGFQGFKGSTKPRRDGAPGYGDDGTAARFFYCAKAGRHDRVARCSVCGARGFGRPPCDCRDAAGNPARRDGHPTTKPVELLAYWARLITPPGGTLLDAFAGSGTLAPACAREGLGAVLVEREPEFLGDIRFRLNALRGGDLPIFADGADVVADGEPGSATLFDEVAG